MTENSANISNSLSKRGFAKYKANPSIPDLDSIKKTKPGKLGGDAVGFVVDGGNGEILKMGGASFYSYEEVDETRFVKLYLEGLKQTKNLSKAGIAVFELVYLQMQKRPGSDQIALSYEQACLYGIDLSERVFRNGIRDLLTHEFIFESLVSSLFFININYLFNGNRLEFVKAYQKKQAINGAS